MTAIDNQGSGVGTTPYPITTGTATDIPGDLDVEGNCLTLGTWINSANNSLNAFAVSYADGQNGAASLLRFGTPRGSLDWIWSEAKSDNTSPQVSMMELDPTHRLILHDSTPQNAPAVTLDPNGPTKYRNAVLLAPQGDIDMGVFTSGTTPY